MKTETNFLDIDMVTLKTTKSVNSIKVVIETTAHKSDVVELHKQHLRTSETGK